MSNILSRIRELAQKEGISLGALERKIGASKGVLARAIANNTDIQAKWLISIVENYPQYSTEWLLTGEGPMLKEEQPAAADERASGNDFAGLIRELMQKISAQAEEICNLKVRIALSDNMLRDFRGGDFHDADTTNPIPAQNDTISSEKSRHEVRE